MFKKLIEEMKRMERGVQVSIPIEPDADGYVDKECPSEHCLFGFKVSAEDWSTPLFSDAAVFCPLCRHEAPAKNWFTTEQVEAAQALALQKAEEIFSNALEESARDFNRRQPRNGLFRISMKVRGTRSRRLTIPVLPGSEPIEQKISCEACGARFAVIGSAFFCPGCGHNSAVRTFDESLQKIELKLKSIPLLSGAMEETEATVVARSLIETGLADCVVAFQRLAERLFVIASGTEPERNVFQRIDDGSEAWRKITGHGYEAWLSAAELDELRLQFQRRHLLAHTEGIVDATYLKKSGDTTYRPGQRIVVSELHVRRTASLVAKLAKGLRGKQFP